MSSHQKFILVTGIWEILIGLDYLLLAIRIANESNTFKYFLLWATLMVILGVTLMWLARKDINRKNVKLGITLLLLLPIIQILLSSHWLLKYGLVEMVSYMIFIRTTHTFLFVFAVLSIFLLWKSEQDSYIQTKDVTFRVLILNAVLLIILGAYNIVMTRYSMDFEQADADEFGRFLISLGIFVGLLSNAHENLATKALLTLILAVVIMIGSGFLISLPGMIGETPPEFPNLTVIFVFIPIFLLSLASLVFLWGHSIKQLIYNLRRLPNDKQKP
ncbi:hypothetical protein [Thermococcus barophilus]|uniref:Uncharacterized protein n=1 Tax=Thermococcus barophilus TaxID=55802 RepID=A0A0S1XD68_THEBA|nr:hypothetical protein [Thermococcus barophilus]ALM75714.1 membrane hypothetical protein [Thermococcus barophilus]